LLEPFKNTPLSDFSQPDNKKKMKDALATVQRQLGREYSLIIGGRRVRTEQQIVSRDPSRPGNIVGTVSKATVELAENALQAAWTAFAEWKNVPAEERARYLFKAAAIMRRRKWELAAWMCYEAGKPWGEADADVAEAIDFLEFYGREMIRLAEPQPLVRIPGEDNELYYVPLGVGVVIPPWNFPLAILTGMTSAAVVAGNTVVLKPASATPVIAAKFMEIIEEAGWPPGVVNYLPGSGEEIGDYLVCHPRTRFINFTGSKEVGIRIYEQAANVQKGQRWIKRVVAEMGGKDAILVDSSADLEEAVTGILQSAFGFAGQKCSACSRVIAVKDIVEELLERIVERARQIKVGAAWREETVYGPVIDEAAFRRILAYIEIGKQEGRLVTGGGQAEGEGYLIQPTIFADVDPKARVAQEEIFGPVLALIRAADFSDAIRIANDTEYGLTGSLYTKNRAHMEIAKREFHVGNLYLNRKCTGALVGVHPFGGFNLSGTDSKAGGRDYLLLFLQAKTVSETL
jgi:1-pyrroline-5-carboxylate dehydrogenase